MLFLEYFSNQDISLEYVIFKPKNQDISGINHQDLWSSNDQKEAIQFEKETKQQIIIWY